MASHDVDPPLRARLRSDPCAATMNARLTPAEIGALPKLRVYVDETGDRGALGSPFFAMTALLVPEEEDWNVRVVAGGLRAMIHASRPDTKTPLHWVDHFKAKHPERRERAARTLSSMPGVKVIHVIVPKRMTALTGGMADGTRFYNYTTRLLLERIAYCAATWEGGPRFAITYFGSVKGVDHTDTASYLTRVRNGLCGETWGVPWQHIKWPPKWTGTDWDGIQLADIHAGILNVALSGADVDQDCAANLLLCKHQLYRSPGGSLLGYGVKIWGSAMFLVNRCWYQKWVII
ncbi:DUF3800 domain-containing protein [Streptomyces sp. NPDC018036]|uniref:DUF3800 domain-containing protein n=1 Tax=Streptomyces sp. NPDC018036 TaxID=3365035 RepID=UPI00378CAC2B